MATRKNEPIGGGEKQATIEITHVRLGGNDATVQEAVRAFSALINRSVVNGNALTTVKRVNALPAANAKGTNGHGHGEPVVEDEGINVELEEEAAVEEPTAPAAPRGAPRKYTVPTAIPIDTEAGVSVDAFVAQYKLESNEEKYLGLAGWMKTHRENQPLKAGHIITLYKHLEWTLPADVTMSFRRLTSKDYQWFERTSRGAYQIHQIGESKLAKLKS